MGALHEHAIRWAYRGQQLSLHVGCGALQALARRVALGETPTFTREEFVALRRRYFDLLERDLANVEAGIYPEQLLFQMPLARYARRLPGLAFELPKMLSRMRRDDWRELPVEADLAAFPPYYRRTFHWQSDGYLSRRSAELYDAEVEFLFGGTGDVMRRQAIVPLRSIGREQPIRVLDVACGTGRFLAQLGAAMPSAGRVGFDLSPYYLEVAGEQLGPDVELVQGNAESLPFPDASFDAVVSIYLFHELPRNARRNVFAQMLRVLRPGGVVVVMDSVQHSDASDIAYFLTRFQRELHEPFYLDYLRDDLGTALEEAGFESVQPSTAAYLSKLVTARKPV